MKQIMPDDRKIPGSVTRRLAKAHLDSNVYDDDHEDKTTVEQGANVVTSLHADDDPADRSVETLAGRVHAPVLDLDIPHVYVPSSTPGHAHLYLDIDVPDDLYWRLLDVLVECDILEEGYVGASKERGYTSARLPWITKGSPEEVESFTPDPWVPVEQQSKCTVCGLPHYRKADQYNHPHTPETAAPAKPDTVRSFFPEFPPLPRPAPSMGCGHTANAMSASGPVCVICHGTDPGADVVVEPPDLTGRVMRCTYRRTRDGRPHDPPVPSNAQAMFFSYRPDQDEDQFYDGCWGWD